MQFDALADGEVFFPLLPVTASVTEPTEPGLDSSPSLNFKI